MISGDAAVKVADSVRGPITSWGSVVIACGATLYFFWENIKGIHESSDKAMKIMKATTVMAVVIMIWCGATLAVKGIAKQCRWHAKRPADVARPDAKNELRSPINQSTPLGYLKETKLRQDLEHLSSPTSKPTDWLSIVGLIGIADRLWPFDPGDERRRDAGPGLSRGRSAEDEELQEGGVHHLRLQPGADRRNQFSRRPA